MELERKHIQTKMASSSPPASPQKISRASFEFIERIGKGSYGRVVRARKNDWENQEYAIKIIEKKLLKLENKTK
jgi:hypothetical protein